MAADKTEMMVRGLDKRIKDPERIVDRLEAASRRAGDLKVLDNKVDGLDKMRAAQVAAETSDFVDKLAEDGDPRKRRIAEIVEHGILGAMEEVSSGRLQPQGESAALEDHPFSNDSRKSLTASLDSSKALPDETSQPEESPSPPTRLAPVLRDAEEDEALQELVRSGQVSPPTKRLGDDFLRARPAAKDRKALPRSFLEEERERR